MRVYPYSESTTGLATCRASEDPIFSWNSFPLWFFKMVKTTGTAWVVNERINKVGKSAGVRAWVPGSPWFGEESS